MELLIFIAISMLTLLITAIGLAAFMLGIIEELERIDKILANKQDKQ